LASRSNRARRSASFDTSSGRTLMATSRSRRVSRARYTSPMPPAPSGALISYGPRRTPGLRLRTGLLSFPWNERLILPSGAQVRAPGAEGQCRFQRATANVWQGMGGPYS
jgi:hypothetical protein